MPGALARRRSAVASGQSKASVAKYETGYGVEFYSSNATIVVTPSKVIGIDGADFVGSPTRWVFPNEPPARSDGSDG